MTDIYSSSWALDIKLVSIKVGKRRNWSECYIIQACFILGFNWLPWANHVLLDALWIIIVLYLFGLILSLFTHSHCSKPIHCIYTVLFNLYNVLNIKLSYCNCFKMSYFCVTQKKTTILRWTITINCIELSGRQTLFGSIDGCCFGNHAIGTVIKLAER